VHPSSTHVINIYLHTDLEGIDEFDTDEGNLEMFLRVHNKPSPQFIRQVAEKTLLVGLTSTVFRSAKYTSHEVTIDKVQLDWFEQTLKDHPSTDGWRIFVFTHAPPNGSGLRVLQGKFFLPLWRVLIVHCSLRS
jgi:hypothetical protein